MSQARFQGTLSLGTGSVLNEMISDATEIDADKLEHIHVMGTNFDLAIGSTPAAREEIVFVASGAGTIRQFSCLLNDTGTSTDVTFDLKVNGTTVLSAGVQITHSDADGTVKTGTISSPTLAADDIVSISLAVTSSTGAQGPFAQVHIDESAA